MGLRLLTFPLVIAVAIASSAHAEQGGNRSSGDNGQVTDSAGSKGQSYERRQNEVRGTLYRASAAYKSAWKTPQKASLVDALKAYRKAAVQALEADGELTRAEAAKLKRYFEAEAKRIEAYFEPEEPKRKRHTDGVEKVKKAGKSEIDTHGVCKIVTNRQDDPMFVPTHTKEEWAVGDRSFLMNLPVGVTARDCPPPPTSSGGGDKDKPNYQKDGYDLGDGRKDKCDDDKCD